jgi:hypothetical protein
MKNTNISITEEQRLNMPFLEYGDNIKVRVVDFEKFTKTLIEERKTKGMSMVIELKAIKIDKHKELSDTISWSKDSMTSIYYGIPFGLHPDGNVKWRKILLQEFNTFNLTRPDEAKQWIVLMMHPHVKGTPFEGADPVFYVYDADVEASLTTKKAMMTSEAINKAYKMKKADTLSFHRYLGINAPLEITPSRIKNDIVSFAMENPEEFMSKYDDPNRNIQELFNSARALGAITYDLDKGFIFKGTFLGFTDIEVIRFLNEDTITLNAINSRVDELDSDKEKFNTDKK